jgi:hypothetical protein
MKDPVSAQARKNAETAPRRKSEELSQRKCPRMVKKLKRVEIA